MLLALETHGIELLDVPRGKTGIPQRLASGKMVTPVHPLASSDDDDDDFDLPSAAPAESHKSSDDPIRMYLSQMAEIPLLSREEEIALAKKIEITRRQFRRALLENDYGLRATYETLVKVHHGELPFDRTIKVSLTERLTKEQISGRMPHNLRTVGVLIEQNQADFGSWCAVARLSDYELKCVVASFVAVVRR